MSPCTGELWEYVFLKLAGLKNLVQPTTVPSYWERFALGNVVREGGSALQFGIRLGILQSAAEGDGV